MGAIRRSRKGLAAGVVVGMAALLSACSGNDASRPVTAGPQATSTTVAPPTSSTSGSATTTAGGADQRDLPFVADTRPDVSSEQVGFPVLASVAEGRHDGYVRYVFTFTNAGPEGHQPLNTEARPAWDVRYVPRGEVVQDGSGNPVAIGGAAHLRIVFQANMHHDDGRSSLESSVSDDANLAFASDFEGRVVWFYGGAEERPFRVEYVGGGRVALDVAR